MKMYRDKKLNSETLRVPFIWKIEKRKKGLGRRLGKAAETELPVPATCTLVHLAGQSSRGVN